MGKILRKQWPPPTWRLSKPRRWKTPAAGACLRPLRSAAPEGGVGTGQLRPAWLHRRRIMDGSEAARARRRDMFHQTSAPAKPDSEGNQKRQRSVSLSGAGDAIFSPQHARAHLLKASYSTPAAAFDASPAPFLACTTVRHGQERAAIWLAGPRQGCCQFRNSGATCVAGSG